MPDVQKKHSIPLIVVGTEVDEKKILIAFDGSANSKKAVDYVGHFADKEDCRILLLTIIRPLSTPNLPYEHLYFKQGYEKDGLDANMRKIVPVMAEMRKRLISCGVMGRVIRKILFMGGDKAIWIV
jgi:nucleotide-binding universal stress UspA family protein